MFDPKQRVLEELSTLVGRHQALDRHLRNADGRIPDQREDWAQALEAEEVVASLDQRTLDRIGALFAALDRITAGTYGLSVVSGEPIDARRLMAIPEATMSAEEAAEAEARDPGVPYRAPSERALGREPHHASSGPGGSRDTRATVPEDERSDLEDEEDFVPEAPVT